AVNGSTGGAIYHATGTLNLVNDVVSDNQANGDTAGGIGLGGAVFNPAGATLVVRHNHVPGNPATGLCLGRGGAPLNDGSATLAGTLFADNQAVGGNAGSPPSSSGAGGDIRTESGATLTVSHSRFTQNQAIGGTTTGGNGSAGAGGAIWI